MMTYDEALALLRSGQMPESRYVQLCDENGWLLGAQLLNEAGNALDDKDAEIERLRAVNEKHHNDIKMLGRTVEEQAAAIADLTGALQDCVYRCYDCGGTGTMHVGGIVPGSAGIDCPNCSKQRAALARAQGAAQK